MGSVRLGSFTSSPAKVMLFQASAEKSAPTMAAPNTDRVARLKGAAPKKRPPRKLASIACSFASPRKGTTTSSARAAILATVNRFCTHLAVLTPRVLM